MEALKGTGQFRIFHASPAQVFDAAAQVPYIGRRSGWSYSRDEDAFIGWKPFAPLSSGHGIAIFTYPADTPGDTKVEVITHFPGNATVFSEGSYLDAIEQGLSGAPEEGVTMSQTGRVIRSKLGMAGRAPISAKPAA